MQPVFVLPVVFAVLVVGSVALTVWLGISILRLVVRGILGLSRLALQPPRRTPNARPCDRWNCQALNPANAQFCRRCGKRLD
jgi:hypothetical protein